MPKISIPAINPVEPNFNRSMLFPTSNNKFIRFLKTIDINIYITIIILPLDNNPMFKSFSQHHIDNYLSFNSNIGNHPAISKFYF